MARGRKESGSQTARSPRDGPVIEPTRVYRREELPGLLRSGKHTIHEAIQDGSLRHTMRGRRQLFLGQWLIDWLSKEPAETAEQG